MSFRFRRNGSWVVAFATMLVLAAITSGVASADPAGEHVYVEGQTYQINNVSPPIFDASHGLLDLASPIYIIGYPVPAGTDRADHVAFRLPTAAQRLPAVSDPLPRPRARCRTRRLRVCRSVASRAVALHHGVRVQH